ncbi:MAG: hypothetical protein SGI74_02585 [Oligoflexia bacterium]|nr:hypothetical protein [Oligoflexia bacterium]
MYVTIIHVRYIQDIVVGGNNSTPGQAKSPKEILIEAKNIDSLAPYLK